MQSKIISDGEIVFTYPRISTVHTRRIARFADGTTRIWSETWGRWTSLQPLASKFATIHIRWN